MANSDQTPDLSEFCQGHYDDDHTLLSGVGIGEPTFCDGTCSGGMQAFLEHRADETDPGEPWERVYDLTEISVGARLRVDHASRLTTTLTVIGGYGQHGNPPQTGLLCRHTRKGGESRHTVLTPDELDTRLVWLSTDPAPTSSPDSQAPAVSGDARPSSADPTPGLTPPADGTASS